MNTAFRKAICLGGLAVMLAALSAAPAMAQIIYNNFGSAPPTFQDQTSIAPPWPVGLTGGTSYDVAFPFQGTGVSFHDAILALGDTTNVTTAKVYLALDSQGVGTFSTAVAPGTQVDTTNEVGLIPTVPTPGAGPVTFNCVGCPVLTSGTWYWIVAVDDTGWYESNSDTGLFAYSAEPGPWVTAQTTDFSGTGFIATRGAYEIDGPAGLPEPSPMLLLSIGLISVMGFAAVRPANN